MGYPPGQVLAKSNEFNMAKGLPVSPLYISDIFQLKNFLDRIQIREALLTPFWADKNYPLVEARELLPSFETDPYEYRHLPGFSLVVLDRPLDYFSEVFQFDLLHRLDGPETLPNPSKKNIPSLNRQTILDRLPWFLHNAFKKNLSHIDLTDLEHYPRVLPYILETDRAHVLAKDRNNNFYLAGLNASLPSDLNSEIKRFGIKIGRFKVGDSIGYGLNRSFVYHFLMELYGFPIASERRTSAALFSRRLMHMGENFMVRVLGQSDRTITTLYTHPQLKHYPRVEKLALVQVPSEMKEARRILGQGRYYVDSKQRVVILRVIYNQHRYNAENIIQNRALSVLRQEIIHPISGRVTDKINLIKDTRNMLLHLNDIVRGEYRGTVTFKGNEVVKDTSTDEKRLKFLYAWLTKHQRRAIGYSDEFYAKTAKIMTTYLENASEHEDFDTYKELHQEVWKQISYIEQARKVQQLSQLRTRKLRHEGGYLQMLEQATDLLQALKLDQMNYFDDLTSQVIMHGDAILNDPYLERKYIQSTEDTLTEYGKKIARQYSQLVAVMDEFKLIRKSRAE